MDELFYEMIFKRKSFHIMKGTQTLNNDELDEIKTYIKSIKPLYSDIKVDYKIVPRIETSCPRGEYCILMYSGHKDNYCQNIGYIGEQLDLWFASKNIGTCWYGLGHTTDLTYNGLEFVMMMTFEKSDTSEFRKDMYKSKRKELTDIWHGNNYLNIANIVRFTPSSCNTQPWLVEEDNNVLTIYRYKKPGKRGMMPIERVNFSNRIDMGIFYLFVELCLKHNNYVFDREIFIDNKDDDTELTLSAKYKIRKVK